MTKSAALFAGFFYPVIIPVIFAVLFILVCIFYAIVGKVVTIRLLVLSLIYYISKRRRRKLQSNISR